MYTYNFFFCVYVLCVHRIEEAYPHIKAINVTSHHIPRITYHTWFRWFCIFSIFFVFVFV